MVPGDFSGWVTVVSENDGGGTRKEVDGRSGV